MGVDCQALQIRTLGSLEREREIVVRRGEEQGVWVSTASRSRSAHLEAWREVEAEIGKWDRWARRMIGRWVNG